MEYTARQLPDGSYELVTKVTQADIDVINAEARAADGVHLNAPQPMFLGISFDRKTAYCVTCPGANRGTTIMAYGDLHAFIMALHQCGAGFSMHKGVCG